MKNIELEKIKVKENVRTDYGDLTEMTVSIQQYGVRNPVELNSKNELIDGFRRFKAAKAAGLKEIPYFINEEDLDKTTSQIISGIFQKNLNPVEEGTAFKRYMEESKINAADLAKKISKKTQYIEKRLLLINLPENVKKALINKKILLGHALLLSKLQKKDSSKYLKDILEENYTVEDAKTSMGYSGCFTKNLKDAKFDKKDCKNCKYNGSVQCELFDEGKILNEDCLNSGCFTKKLTAFVKELKKKYKDVLFEGGNYEDPRGYVDAEREYQLKENGIDKSYMKKCRKEKDNYLIKIMENGSIREYFKIPIKLGSKDKSSENSESKSEDSLQTKVNNFKENLLINKSEELMKPGTIQTKALGLICMLQRADYSEKENLKGYRHFFGEEYVSEINVKAIFKASEEDLDKAIAMLSVNSLRRMSMKELIESSKNFGVDINKHFELSNDFLQLHTKDQLINLIKELGSQLDKGIVKKQEIIEFILSKNLKGEIPKIIK